MKSMTGYAYKECSIEDGTLSIEIKCYNSRFLDLTVNQPWWLSRIETKLREFASRKVQRGKMDVTVRVRERNANIQVTADPGAARSYMEAITEIADALSHTDAIPLSLIVAQEGVLKSERTIDPERYWLLLEPVLESAFADFEASRITEGIALKRDILNMISRLDKDAEIFESWVPEMEKIFKDSVRSRFEELLGSAVDEQRVMQETAALLMKYTINEEIVRLRAHLVSLRNELESNPAPGRKADFICQEINREVNTIGSKNQILEVGAAVIDAKDALENIREQMRNIE